MLKIAYAHLSATCRLIFNRSCMAGMMGSHRDRDTCTNVVRLTGHIIASMCGRCTIDPDVHLLVHVTPSQGQVVWEKLMNSGRLGDCSQIYSTLCRRQTNDVYVYRSIIISICQRPDLLIPCLFCSKTDARSRF
jgi:hypothetical protein